MEERVEATDAPVVAEWKCPILANPVGLDNDDAAVVVPSGLVADNDILLGVVEDAAVADDEGVGSGFGPMEEGGNGGGGVVVVVDGGGGRLLHFQGIYW